MSDEMKEYRVKLPDAESLTEMIVEHVASQMMHGGEYRDGILDDVRSKVVERVSAAIDAEVVRIVGECLAATVQPTNQFGEPQGEPVTLRYRIAAQVERALNAKVDNYGRARGDREYSSYDEGNHKTRVERAISAAVDDIAKKEIAAALKAASDEMRARIGGVVQKSVQETVKKLLALP